MAKVRHNVCFYLQQVQKSGYTLHSTDGVRVLFYGTEEDIISDPLTVEEQFTIDSDKLDIDLTLTDSLVLPTLEFAEYDTT